jgi:hypothetical protein
MIFTSARDTSWGQYTLEHMQPEPAEPGNVGVFVLHYGNSQRTNAGIESWISEALALEAEVYVIDNSGDYIPADGVLPLDMTIIDNAGNPGIVDSFNRGMREHPQDIYICITDDTRKAKNIPLLSGLVDCMQNNSAIGIAAPGTNDKRSGTLFTPTPLGKPDHYTRHVDMTCTAYRHDLFTFAGLPDATGHPDRYNWYSNKLYALKARELGFHVVAATGSAYIRHVYRKKDSVHLEAHKAGIRWLKQRLGDRWKKAW